MKKVYDETIENRKTAKDVKRGGAQSCRVVFYLINVRQNDILKQDF